MRQISQSNLLQEVTPKTTADVINAISNVFFMGLKFYDDNRGKGAFSFAAKRYIIPCKSYIIHRFAWALLGTSGTGG